MERVTKIRLSKLNVTLRNAERRMFGYLLRSQYVHTTTPYKLKHHGWTGLLCLQETQSDQRVTRCWDKFSLQLNNNNPNPKTQSLPNIPDNNSNIVDSAHYFRQRSLGYILQYSAPQPHQACCLCISFHRSHRATFAVPISTNLRGKQSIWLRTDQSGGCWQLVVLSTRTGTCWCVLPEQLTISINVVPVVVIS